VTTELEAILRAARNATPTVTYSTDPEQEARYWKSAYEAVIAAIDAALAGLREPTSEVVTDIGGLRLAAGLREAPGEGDSNG
jgi:hypothetical protein